MGKISDFRNFLRSYVPSVFLNKEKAHTVSPTKLISSSQSKSSLSAEQSKSAFSECVISMKNLLEDANSANAKTFNERAENDFLRLFADIGVIETGSQEQRSGIEIFRETLGINSISVKSLEQMIVSFEVANQIGQLDEYDPVIASMFFEAIKARLVEESKNNPNQGYDLLAIRMQKIITDITTLRQKDVKMEQLGSGAFGTLYKVQVGEQMMLFKPEGPEDFEKQMLKEGDGDRRNEERSVLTWNLAHALKFDEAVLRTEHANINGQKGLLMERPSGYVQIVTYTYPYQPDEFQKNVINQIVKNPENYLFNPQDGEYVLKEEEKAKLQKYISEPHIEVKLDFESSDPWQEPLLLVTKQICLPRDPLDAKYQRQSVELGLVDWLTGQIGRDLGTIVGGKGIDNERGWKTSQSTSKKTQLDDVSGEFYGTVSLPLVVDTHMKASIEALSDDALRASLGGYLMQAEIEAAVERLNQLKEHLESGKVKVIQPDDDKYKWGTEEVRKLLCTKEIDQEGNEVWTSYLGRDIDYNKYFANMGVKEMTPEEFERFKAEHPLET